MAGPSTSSLKLLKQAFSPDKLSGFMFLKRSLVVVVGTLLFIGVLLLKLHLTQAHLESEFQHQRERYGVEGEVVTLPKASHRMPSPSSSQAPAPVTTKPAQEPIAISADDASPAASNPPASTNSDEPNLIIAPEPANPPDQNNPAPSAEPAPSPDNNGSSTVPPAPSTMNFHRSGTPVVFLDASYRPSEAALFLSADRVSQTGASNQTPANKAPTPAVTNVPATNPAPGFPNSNAPAATMPSTHPTKGLLPHATSAGGRAIVLGYHQFTGPGIPSKNIYSMSQDVFEQEMQYLRDNGYTVVPLSDVVRFVKHEIGLPPNAVAITIDDGYKSALNYAAPVLKKFGYPWTYFVYPAFITKTEGKGAASWPDLIELDREGVDVESHSMTHPQLTKKRQRFHGSLHVLSPEEYDQFLTEETLGAKQLLEQQLGKKIKYFAYPYGDYNKQVQAKAIAAGYEAIFTVAGNPVHITTDINSIGRYIITRPDERSYVGFLKQGALSLAQVDPEPGATISNPSPVITAVLGFNGDPASLETEIKGIGIVRHDFDPQTSTVRIYLPRPLIAPQVFVNIHAKDDQSGQTMVASWHFNYEPASGAITPAHGPISSEPTYPSGVGESSEHNPGPASESSPATNAAMPATSSPVAHP